jgi:hypothetical protein
MTTLASLTVDELAEGICLQAGRIPAGQAELPAVAAAFVADVPVRVRVPALSG